MSPRLRALPMAWRWALWCCQGIHQQCVKTAGLSAHRRVRTGSLRPTSPIAHISSSWAFFAVMGKRRPEVEKDLQRVCKVLRNRDLALH